MRGLRLKATSRERTLSRIEWNDVSTWNSVSAETTGARAKLILEDPKSRFRHLLKFPKYGQFEIVTEIFNSILAEELELRHVKYFPAIYNGNSGVICRSFLNPNIKGQELWEMKELICRHSSLDKNLLGRSDEVLRQHNLDDIYMITEAEFGKEVFSGLFQMIAFDALIGHGDRHWSNYGFLVSLRDKELSVSFAPVYDTASGYLTEITGTAEKAEESLLKEKLNGALLDREWYRPKKKALCKITVPGDIKANHFDLLGYIIKHPQMSKYKPQLLKIFRKFHPDMPKKIIRKFFPELDPLRGQIIETILKTRHEIGMGILR